MNPIIYALISLCTLVCSAMFAGFENGMISIRRARLDHAVAQGSYLAKLIKRFLNRPNIMLATVLLGTNLCQAFSAIAFNELVRELFFDRFWLSALASALLTLLILIFAEITPKVWFRQRPLERCRLMIYPIYLFHLLCYPFIRILTFLVRLLQWFFPERRGSDTVLMREDFRLMLRESEHDGQISPESRLLLENSLEYEQQTVRNMMVAKDRVQALSADTTLAEAMEAGRDTELSRFPVYLPGQPERWIGIFAIYDAIYSVPPEQWKAATVLEHIRPMTVVSANSKPSQVLQRARLARSPLLVVLDEKINQAGIISVSDVIRPLFGHLEP